MVIFYFHLKLVKDKKHFITFNVYCKNPDLHFYIMYLSSGKPNITKPDQSNKKIKKTQDLNEKSLSVSPPPLHQKQDNPRANSKKLKFNLNDDNYSFNIEKYKLISKLNNGSFGNIYIVEDITTKQRYAAKTYKNAIEEQQKFYALREINILIQIQHPTIIKFHGASPFDFKGKPNITILMDLAENGSLADLIEREKKSLLPHEIDNTKKQIILVGIARAMMFTS